MKKDISIEYAHIYTNNHVSDEQELSLEVLNRVRMENEGRDISFVVMVDDYSFPDPAFDYDAFVTWLGMRGFKPDFVLRESQLIPVCDIVLREVTDLKLKEQISDYVRAKKYPCSLFVAAWYLTRLGYVRSGIFDEQLISGNLINILPVSFRPFEEKAFEIIEATPFKDAVKKIENKYFEGRLLA